MLEDTMTGHEEFITNSLHAMKYLDVFFEDNDGVLGYLIHHSTETFGVILKNDAKSLFLNYPVEGVYVSTIYQRDMSKLKPGFMCYWRPLHLKENI